MKNPGPTKEDYDTLIYKPLTLEREIKQARKLLEAPAKRPSWWRRFWGHATVVALVMVLWVPPALSQTTLEIQRDALRELKGVYIQVPVVPSKLEHIGVDKEQIKVDVELRLRKAGIRVLTKDEAYNTPGRPWLGVNLTGGPNAGYCAFSVTVKLYENVTLARGYEVLGVIWNIGSVGMSKTNIRATIRSSIGEQVDRFINDYLAANPKK